MEDLKFIIPILISIVTFIWIFFQQKRIEELKSKIGKEALVHKLQFEKEFQLNEKLWGYINKLRPKLKRPLSIVEMTHVIELPSEDMQEFKYDNNAVVLKDLKLLFEANEPYFHPEIKKVLNKIILILVEDPLSENKELFEAYKKISILIQERNNIKHIS